MSSASHRLKCPGCAATYLYSSDKIDESNSVVCQNCAMRFSTQLTSDGLAVYPEDDSEAIKPSVHFLSKSVEGVRIKCPNCGSKYIYTDEHKLDGPYVSCQNCGSEIDYVGENILIVTEPAQAGAQTEDWGFCVALILVILFVPLLFAIPVALCMVGWKVSQGRGSTDLDSKIVKRDAEGPGPG